MYVTDKTQFVPSFKIKGTIKFKYEYDHYYYIANGDGRG